MAELKVTSSAFSNMQALPEKHTCKALTNPPLSISGIPPAAKSLVLIVDDPDAPSGVWNHWLIWNIKPSSKIDEASVPAGAIQGKNDYGNNEYFGPCPPSGSTHRYFFRVYALDTLLSLPEGATRMQLNSAMNGHILAEGELIGIYGRK